jgi:hypothetical protein
MSDFLKWLIVGWPLVVVGIAGLGVIPIVKFGEVKKIATDDITLCFIMDGCFLLAHPRRCLFYSWKNVGFLILSFLYKSSVLKKTQ